MKKVRKRDIDQDVAEHMKATYHMTDADIMRIARQSVNGVPQQKDSSRRGKAFKVKKPKPRAAHSQRR